VIPRVISELLGPGDRSVQAADGAGSAGRSWITSDGRRKLFVKTGVSAALLRLVADLGVAPLVVASRDVESGSVVAQEFVDGVSPDERWVDEHIERVVRFMRRYQTHSDLTALTELSTHDSSEVAPAELALTHGDPNTSNLILARDGRLYLIDWDDACLSDPMRDIGPLLWWYVRPDRWPLALAAADLDQREDVGSSVYRWASIRSFEVAEWLTSRGNPVEGAKFALDGDAAQSGLHNPRAWWR
jgi:hypothetical protein